MGTFYKELEKKGAMGTLAPPGAYYGSSDVWFPQSLANQNKYSVLFATEPKDGHKMV